MESRREEKWYGGRTEEEERGRGGGGEGRGGEGRGGGGGGEGRGRGGEGEREGRGRGAKHRRLVSTPRKTSRQSICDKQQSHSGSPPRGEHRTGWAT